MVLQFDYLPKELRFKIFGYLSFTEKFQTRIVSKQWKEDLNTVLADHKVISTAADSFRQEHINANVVPIIERHRVNAFLKMVTNVCPKLEALHLVHCSLSPSCVRLVANILHKHNRLRVLEISSCRFESTTPVRTRSARTTAGPPFQPLHPATAQVMGFCQLLNDFQRPYLPPTEGNPEPQPGPSHDAKDKEKAQSEKYILSQLRKLEVVILAHNMIYDQDYTGPWPGWRRAGFRNQMAEGNRSKLEIIPLQQLMKRGSSRLRHLVIGRSSGVSPGDPFLLFPGLEVLDTECPYWERSSSFFNMIKQRIEGTDKLECNLHTIRLNIPIKLRSLAPLQHISLTGPQRSITSGQINDWIRNVAIEHGRSLRSFELGDYVLNKGVLTVIVANCPHLRVLKIGHNMDGYYPHINIYQNGDNAKKMAIKSELSRLIELRELEYLALNYMPCVTDDLLVCLFNSLPTLRHLEFAHCKDTSKFSMIHINQANYFQPLKFYVEAGKFKTEDLIELASERINVFFKATERSKMHRLDYMHHDIYGEFGQFQFPIWLANEHLLLDPFNEAMH